ncbi:hypothetical protein V2J09_003349 [Rumex salicifolius]
MDTSSLISGIPLQPRFALFLRFHSSSFLHTQNSTTPFLFPPLHACKLHTQHKLLSAIATQSAD